MRSRLLDLWFGMWLCVSCALVPVAVAGQTGDELTDTYTAALASYRAGEFNEAADGFEAATRLAEEKLGPEHPDTIRIMNNLVAILRSLGQTERAIGFADVALERSRAAFGDGDPVTLIAMHNRASLFQAQGRFDDAQSLYESALTGRREALGAGAGPTLQTMTNLAQLYAQTGRFDEAKALFLETLELAGELADADVAEVRAAIAAMNNLGEAYRSRGRYDDAEVILQQAFSLARQTFEEHDELATTTAMNLALVLETRARYEQAEAIYATVLRARRSTLGETSPAVASVLNSLGVLYQAQGRFDEAQDHLEQAFAISEAQLGPDAGLTLSIIFNQAQLDIALGQFDGAEEKLRRVVDARSTAAGQADAASIAALNGLVAFLIDAGRYSEAEPLSERAFDMSDEALGQEHPDALAALMNLAALRQAQRRDKGAERLFSRALDLRRQVFGENHPESLAAATGLAGVYMAQGRFAEAEPLYELAAEQAAAVLGEGHPRTVQYFSNLAGLRAEQSRFEEAADLYSRAREAGRLVLGSMHPAVLTIMNNQALLMMQQGRLAEAEPLFGQVLDLRRMVLGEDHPAVLTTMNGRGLLYVQLGNFAAAEVELQHTLTRRRDLLGETHPDTLATLNNMAYLSESQGRYGKAELEYDRALELRLATLGEKHPDTIESYNNKGAVFSRQGRLAAAEPQYRRALILSREVLGRDNALTLTTLNNLAYVYSLQAKFAEAESHYETALERRTRVLGESHPDTLASLNNLAALHERQGLYDLAEAGFGQALAKSSETLGERHPQTLAVLANLAALKTRMGKYEEGEALFRTALRDAQAVYRGGNHPESLGIQLHYASNLAAQGRPADAAQALARMERPLLEWIGVEFYETERTSVVRGLVASQRAYLDWALSLAIQFPEDRDAQEVAASAILRFKSLQAEEEAVIGRLARTGRDGEIGVVAAEIRELNNRLSQAYHNNAKPAEVAEIARALDAKKRALGELTNEFSEQLRVQGIAIDDLRNALPYGVGVVEYVRYRPVDFAASEGGPDRWSAVVLDADGVRTIDLGEVGDTAAAISAVTYGKKTAEADARRLFDQLAAPLDLDLYYAILIAPDDMLHLVPFHGLVASDGRYWSEMQDLRVIQSARDLMRKRSSHPATGLLAAGNIDYGKVDGREPPPADPEMDPLAADVEYSRTAAAAIIRRGFAPLPDTGREVTEIEQLYRAARPTETVTNWSEGDASEAKLFEMEAAPRVLHLATHGFYLEPHQPADRPMLLSGVALSGANLALTRQADQGILYALEAQALNLEGTELVVLSACETAQGVVGYSEGIYGLVRALRTAGAQNVLVTLRTIGDQSAAEFMAEFYTRWLSQPPGTSDPPAALQDTLLHYIDTDPDFDWLPFQIIGVDGETL